jgi:uncharacterized protein
MEDLVAALRVEVQADFDEDGTGHDLSHLDRVYGLAEHLRLKEGGDPLVLAAASYVHDFHRVVEHKAGSYDAHVERTTIDDLIQKALGAVDFPGALIPHVCDCVAFTDRYSFSGHALESPSIEARILRDADNLDALGAIGVARAFMFGGALREPIWIAGVEPSDIYEAGKTTSVVHHFHEKLLRLKDDMLTASGRELAEERHEFMVLFLDELKREWRLADIASRGAAPTA